MVIRLLPACFKFACSFLKKILHTRINIGSSLKLRLRSECLTATAGSNCRRPALGPCVERLRSHEPRSQEVHDHEQSSRPRPEMHRARS
ncbi:hypothetical protein AK812_SmicGene33519 [Symbiodinium microadriaticum]|uniref:Uncharacterized protein n=1 Tax=Symbiodinium microadriaticum TaxID=2951 RepID=A0A1Q9CRE6_SYMMI|nr:hypothetical protein AK812_SmicGene33519 [Symbiodinium microadriaticum]